MLEQLVSIRTNFNAVYDRKAFPYFLFCCNLLSDSPQKFDSQRAKSIIFTGRTRNAAGELGRIDLDRERNVSNLLTK